MIYACVSVLITRRIWIKTKKKHKSQGKFQNMRYLIASYYLLLCNGEKAPSNRDEKALREPCSIARTLSIKMSAFATRARAGEQKVEI